MSATLENISIENPEILTEYAKKILNSRVYDVARETPLEIMRNLSIATGNEILLKREDLQPVFSFKIRGAYNKMAGLDAESLKNGVITASAGNHAQGVAMAALRAGIKSLIVMPKTTPRIKVNAVRQYNADIILSGNSYDEAYEYAEKLCQQKKMVFIHPYDDPDVIAGQGTIANEILKQCTQDIHAIFVPVGGGGLIAGITAFVKFFKPEIKIIGVEPDDASCLYHALKARERIKLDQVGIFADGVAVRQIGKYPFEIAKQYVDDILVVSSDEMCAAIKDIYNDTRSIAEPAGALGIAGLKKYIETNHIHGKRLVTIDTGANINFDRLRHVAERAELGENRETLLAVSIPEQKGSFRYFCKAVGPRNITEFNYRYSDENNAYVFVGIQLNHGDEEKTEIMRHLHDHGYSVVDLSKNDLAKEHVRHMVGGRSQVSKTERLFRFKFPERPGALLRFLNQLGDRWNICLFHYRNHGAAFGRVLVSIEMSDTKNKDFETFLAELGYPYTEETGNLAYKMFLQ